MAHKRYIIVFCQKEKLIRASWNCARLSKHSYESLMMESEADGRRGKRNRNIQRSLQLGKKGEDNFNKRRDIWAYKYILLRTQQESVGSGVRVRESVVKVSVERQVSCKTLRTEWGEGAEEKSSGAGRRRERCFYGEMYVIRDDAGSRRLSSKYSSDRGPPILSDAASQPERGEEMQMRTNLAKRCSDRSGSKERRHPCQLGEMLRGSSSEQRMNPAQHPLLVTPWNCLLERLH